MADSRNEVLVTELPVNADQVLFVEDLFDYTELQYPPNYDMKWDPRPFRENIYYDSERTIKNAFNSIVKNALRFFEYVLDTSHGMVFSQIQRDNSINSNIYKRFAENLAADFPKNFHPKYFFMYCVILCRISELFYKHDVLNATLLAKEYVLKCFQKYNMGYEEWYSVGKYAEMYEEIQKNAENVPSLDSDETEHHVQQQKLGCRKKKPFLKKSVQRFLETNPENEKMYNDIKVDCKQMMILAWNIIKAANYGTGLEQNKSILKSAPDNRFCPGPSSAYQEPAHVGEIDCARNLSMSLNAIDSKNSKTLNNKADKMMKKISFKDRFCHIVTLNTYQKSSSTSKNDCKRKLAFSSDVTNGVDYPSRSSGGNNLISKAEPKSNLGSKVPNTAQLSVSSRRQLDFASNNIYNTNVENIPLTRARSLILRDTIKNTGLERFSPSSSDQKKSPSDMGNLK